jgi:nucleotide-binding universal stress UspA family protein
MEFKNILVATDGSEYAHTAMGAAIEIAKRIGSGLTVISVAHTEEEKKQARTHADDDARAAQQAGVHVQTEVPVGKPHEVIAAAAKDKGVDLIVMGAYGKTGLRKLLMGSTTEKVIGLARCAVLVAKITR